MKPHKIPWNCHYIRRHSLWSPSHGPSPDSSKVRSKDGVSIAKINNINGAIIKEFTTYHALKIGLGWAAQHRLQFSCLDGAMDLVLCETLEILLYGLDVHYLLLGSCG